MPADAELEEEGKPSPWASFQNQGFRKYWIAHLAAGFAVQIQTVAVGWQVYDLTRNPLDLGFVGLSQFLPALLLFLVTGAASDRYPRRVIMSFCLMAEALCAASLLAFTMSGGGDVRVVFLILAALGTARAFYNPARQSIVPNLVPAAWLANAITLNTTAIQVATIAGPVAGGLLYGLRPEAAYIASFLLLAAAAWTVLLIPKPVQETSAEPRSWQTVLAGVRYIWRQKVVLGAISLDLFTVLLGGAVALMPVYARDVLDVGPWGLGLLRAAPAIGALVLAYYLISNPIRRDAGRIMFLAVLTFGLATILFGLSTIVWLSVAALVVMGACDMVSVYVRNTLIQLWTPDAVRGRVNAVNQVFIGASNEVGGFRAGASAAVIGAVPAVVVGGIGAVLVAVLWARWFPELRAVQRLDVVQTGNKTG